jgi:hypothetical protein
MPRCKLIALTNPAPGKEAEYNEWYQNTHLPEMVSFPGVYLAQRYKLVAQMGADPNQYLAVYGIEVDDPAAFAATLIDASAAGKFTPCTASDDTTTYRALFVECNEAVVAKR